MSVVKILDDKVLLFVHLQDQLLDRRVPVKMTLYEHECRESSEARLPSTLTS